MLLDNLKRDVTGVIGCFREGDFVVSRFSGVIGKFIEKGWVRLVEVFSPRWQLHFSVDVASESSHERLTPLARVSQGSDSGWNIIMYVLLRFCEFGECRLDSLERHHLFPPSLSDHLSRRLSPSDGGVWRASSSLPRFTWDSIRYPVLCVECVALCYHSDVIGNFRMVPFDSKNLKKQCCLSAGCTCMTMGSGPGT